MTLNEFTLLDNVKIIDFNPDFVSIPGSENYFYLQSAIMFYPTNSDRPRAGGHYTCIQRVDNCCDWIEIDDITQSIKIYDQFPKYMSNVYLLILVKVVA